MYALRSLSLSLCLSLSLSLSPAFRSLFILSTVNSQVFDLVFDPIRVDPQRTSVRGGSAIASAVSAM